MGIGKLDKPCIGEPCNGCGLCCRIVVCMNGAYVQGLVNRLGETAPGPCPALTQKHDGSWTCGVVMNPKKYLKHRPYPADVLSRNFAHLIGAGTGCDELGYDDNPEEEVALTKIVEETKNDLTWIKKSKIALKVIHGIEV